MHLYHMTNSANQNSSCYHEAEHKATIKLPTVIMFCKQTVLYILHTKKVSEYDQAIPQSHT